MGASPSCSIALRLKAAPPPNNTIRKPMGAIVTAIASIIGVSRGDRPAPGFLSCCPAPIVHSFHPGPVVRHLPGHPAIGGTTPAFGIGRSTSHLCVFTWTSMICTGMVIPCSGDP